MEEASGKSAPVVARIHREASEIARLAGPLIANNLALAGMNFSDAVMAGRIGRLDLAGVAVGNSIWIALFLLGLGTLFGLSPTVAHCYGRGEARQVGSYVRQSLWLGQGLAAVLAVIIWCSPVFIRSVGVDASVVPVAQGYLRAMLPGLPAIYAYLTLRFLSEGMGHTRPIMFMALIGLVVNVAGNYVLMYGKLGFPAMGATGCGLASALAMWTMFGCMLGYVRRGHLYRPFAVFERFEKPDLSKLRELAFLGGPIGLAMIAEVGLFSATSLLMGRLGAQVVAAHQIAINYAATTFMIPLGLHSATTIRVGQATGRGEHEAARFSGTTGIAMCGGVMGVSALALLMFRFPVTGIYTSDVEVRTIASGLLAVATLFQVFDGLAIGAAGGLRGLRDTRVPMLINFFAFWAVGFPLAYLTGVVAELGPQWIWAGLVAGLAVAAVLLVVRFLKVTGRASVPATALSS